MSKTVMIVGLGDVGSWALEFLARADGVDSIATSDLRSDWGSYRTELAAVGANMNGSGKTFSFHTIDARDIDQTARTLDYVKPDVIINTSTLLSPRSVKLELEQIPGEIGEQAADALNIGTQLPWHLSPVYNLMLAKQKAGISAQVVNVSFADVVNPVLWAAGLGVTCGAGNCEHIAYEIIRIVSKGNKCSTSDVKVFFVGGGSGFLHHGPKIMPFYLKILVRGEDVTNQYDSVRLIDDGISSRFFNEGSQPQLFSTPAASASKNALAILNDTREFMPVNSPLGLVGDYPAHLGFDGADLDLPSDLSRTHAEEIGRAALPSFGIQSINEDGTTVYTDEAYYKSKTLLGYDCREINPADASVRAKELMGHYQKLLERLR